MEWNKYRLIKNDFVYGNTVTIGKIYYGIIVDDKMIKIIDDDNKFYTAYIVDFIDVTEDRDNKLKQLGL